MPGWHGRLERTPLFKETTHEHMNATNTCKKVPAPHRAQPRHADAHALWWLQVSRRASSSVRTHTKTETCVRRCQIGMVASSFEQTTHTHIKNRNMCETMPASSGLLCLRKQHTKRQEHV